MANEEQLAILKRGVEAWNAWTTAHADEQVDLQGANLHGAELSVVMLSDAILSGAILNKATLSGADLSGAAVGSPAGSAGARTLTRLPQPPRVATPTRSPMLREDPVVRRL